MKYYRARLLICLSTFKIRVQTPGLAGLNRRNPLISWQLRGVYHDRVEHGKIFRGFILPVSELALPVFVALRRLFIFVGIHS